MGREVALKVAVHRVEGAHPVIFNNVVRVFIDAGRADLLTLDMLDGDPVEFTDEEYGSLSVTVAELTGLRVALPPPGSAADVEPAPKTASDVLDEAQDAALAIVVEGTHDNDREAAVQRLIHILLSPSAPDAWDTDVHSEVGGEQGEAEVEAGGGVVERSDERGGEQLDDGGGESEH